MKKKIGKAISGTCDKSSGGISGGLNGGINGGINGKRR